MNEMVKRRPSRQGFIRSAWLSPALFLGAFSVVFVLFLWFLRENTYATKRAELAAQAELVRESIRYHLNGNRDYLLMIAQDRADGLMDATSFQERASRFVADHPELICINWVDAEYLITDVAPIAPNKQIVGLRLNLPEPRRASRLARETRRPVYTRPFEVIQGELAFELWVPVFRDHIFLGLFGGIYSLGRMLNSLVDPHVLKANHISLVEEASGKVLLALPQMDTVDENLVQQVSLTSPESGTSVRFRGYKQGPILWSLWSLEVLCLGLVFGMTYAMWGLKREIQIRQRTEETLADKEAHYRGLFEDSPISLWEEDFSAIREHFDALRASGVSDFRVHFEKHPEEVARCASKAKILAVNQTTLKLYKADNQDLLLAGLPLIFDEDSLPIFKEELITLADGNLRFQSEAVQKNLAGEKFFTVIRLSIAPGYEDTWKRVFVSISDISDRKRAELEIGKLNQELERRVLERTSQFERANKELEAFAYSVSHDLRAPLRHIDGFVELLRDRIKGTLDKKSLDYMAFISNSANRMARLIDDLLAFSRLGRSELSKSQVNLGNLVREVLRDFEPEMKSRSINWKISDLPVVSGDRNLLRQVFVNLISNALKYTRSRQKAEIEIGRLQDDERETIFIRDNGIGFNMNYSEKLFGVFQRLHRSEEFEGNGIGLANVRRIITRHGGKTWAEGEENQGATFFFSLPKT